VQVYISTHPGGLHVAASPAPCTVRWRRDWENHHLLGGKLV